MNIHNKLKELGFKKTGYYRSEWNAETGYSMVRDDYIETKVKVSGKYQKRLKDHPKSYAVYSMNFSKGVKLWAFIKLHELYEILIEDDSVSKFDKDRIKSIWNFRMERVNSKNDILEILPLHIKREFILNQILK